MPKSKFHPVSPYGCQSGNSKEAFVLLVEMLWLMCSFLLLCFFLGLAFDKLWTGYAEKVSILFCSRMKRLSQACVGEKVNTKIQVPLGKNESQNFPADYCMSLTLIWETKLEAMSFFFLMQLLCNFFPCLCKTQKVSIFLYETPSELKISQKCSVRGTVPLWLCQGQ